MAGGTRAHLVSARSTSAATTIASRRAPSPHSCHQPPCRPACVAEAESSAAATPHTWPREWGWGRGGAPGIGSGGRGTVGRGSGHTATSPHTERSPHSASSSTSGGVTAISTSTAVPCPTRRGRVSRKSPALPLPLTSGGSRVREVPCVHVMARSQRAPPPPPPQKRLRSRRPPCPLRTAARTACRRASDEAAPAGPRAARQSARRVPKSSPRGVRACRAAPAARTRGLPGPWRPPQRPTPAKGPRPPRP